MAVCIVGARWWHRSTRISLQLPAAACMARPTATARAPPQPGLEAGRVYLSAHASHRRALGQPSHGRPREQFGELVEVGAAVSICAGSWRYAQLRAVELICLN